MFLPAFPVWRFRARCVGPANAVLQRLRSALEGDALSGEVAGDHLEAHLSERAGPVSPTLSAYVKSDVAGTVANGWFLMPAHFPMGLVLFGGLVWLFVSDGSWDMVLGALAVFTLVVAITWFKITKVARLVREAIALGDET